jgi:L-threonylcarbamoyladenylate synthase
MGKSIKLSNLKKEILAGKIFIYPTDTIYGLGCNAENKEAVEKIKQIKGRDKDKPLSIIAPSIKWIKDNLVVDLRLEDHLPGPYTIILKKKNPTFLSHVSSNDAIGVRIPNHELTKEIQKALVPFITTSVNLSGEPPLIKLEDLNQEIASVVDYIIEAENEAELSGKPSTLIINGKALERK